MSQRDLAVELRASHVAAPDEVRERVRLIAAGDRSTSPPRRFTWRRALVVALPVAAAIAAAIVFTRPTATDQQHGAFVRGLQTTPTAQGEAARAHSALQSVPAPLAKRVQQYEAWLALRIPTSRRVSGAVSRAQRIVTSLGGYPVSINADSGSKNASADLTFKVPRIHVQEAIARLSALGTITGEHVNVQDLEAGLNGTDREILRLQRQLADLRSQTQTDAVKRRTATITAHIQRLQRGTADTRRTAHYATVSLHLATPQPAAHSTHHGPLHGLVVALRWIGIGAIYVLALGVPALVLVWLVWLAVRAVRRRREDELLSGP
ncbi:MAG: DUF4349 domain-containing protein [Gaiellaceae bacterium]